MKIKITKSKPIAKALIIKSKGSMPLGKMMAGPMDGLVSSLIGRVCYEQVSYREG